MSVSCAQVRRELESGRVGGMFGLLEMAAQRSTQQSKLGEIWRTETWDTGGDENIVSNTSHYKLLDVYGGYTYSDWSISWSSNWAMIPAEQKTGQQQTGQQQAQETPATQVDNAISGALTRLRGNCLTEVLGLLRRAAATFLDDPATPQNEYTQANGSQESIQTIYEREIFNWNYLENTILGATINVEYENANVRSESGDSFNIWRATAQGNTLTTYGGFFRNVERVEGRLERPDENGLNYAYTFGTNRTNAQRQLTIIHELLHLAGSGVFTSDQQLGSLILNRAIGRVTQAQGSAAIDTFLNQHCNN